MISIKPTEIRNNQKEIFDKVYHESETVIVARPNNENVVILSESDYNKLLKGYENARYMEMLKKSMKELDDGKGIVMTLEEMDNMTNE
jgi:Phd_YefM.